MSREVRRVPMGWQHPMHWTPRWDRTTGTSPMTLVPRALFDDYPDALSEWEAEGAALARREGWDWKFFSEYCLTGYQGQDDSEPTIHPFSRWVDDEEVDVTVRDADHLHELLTERHAAARPDPDNYMPEFPEGTATGWCMYETTSEGTPTSPVLGSPEELARWLADNKASTFGSLTADYNTWLRMIQGPGWAPSAVAVGGSLRSGVESITKEASR